MENGKFATNKVSAEGSLTSSLLSAPLPLPLPPLPLPARERPFLPPFFLGRSPSSPSPSPSPSFFSSAGAASTEISSGPSSPSSPSPLPRAPRPLPRRPRPLPRERPRPRGFLEASPSSPSPS